MSLPNWLVGFRGQVRTNEILAQHTTFCIGGAADWFLVPDDAEALAQVYNALVKEQVPTFVLGKGSNVLFGDKGFRGAVLSTEKLSAIRLLDGGRILAEAGAELKDVCAFALAHGLTGLEFACGIPGSVGGALYMNAGAYDGEMSSVVESVTVLRTDGSINEISRNDMRFGYRTSLVQCEGGTILAGTIKLQHGEQALIFTKMDDFNTRRAEKQPLTIPSAGSTFKRPEGHFAGKLIMDAGLRGFSIGGAQVSELHCGFVVNKGGATAVDVLALIAHIRQTVHSRFGVWLEPEVRLIGE